nr:TPA_asm: hypothetical protein HUJ06_031642 [Nelumbo nucifera]
MPYKSLPPCIKNSASCKIVYVTGNPRDTFISLWYFLNEIHKTCEEQGSHPMEELFDDFCDGVYPMGPFFDNVVGYWEESLRQPEKILFLRYDRGHER